MNRKDLFKKYYKSPYHDYEIEETLAASPDEHIDIAFIYSGRNRGKSYEVTTQLIADAYYDKKLFGYIRRNDATIYDVEQYFADKHQFISDMTDGKYVGITKKAGKLVFYGEEINKESGEVKRKIGDDCGYFFALSRQRSYKSLQYPEVFNLLYEEVMTDGNYLQAEPEKLMNLYSTVIRGGKPREECRMWLVSNTVSAVNPYSQSWGIYFSRNKPGDIRLSKLYLQSYNKEGEEDYYFIASHYLVNKNDLKPEDLKKTKGRNRIKTGIASNKWDELQLFTTIDLSFMKPFKPLDTAVFELDDMMIQCDIIEVPENVLDVYQQDEDEYDDPLVFSKNMMPIAYFRRKTSEIKAGTRTYSNNANRFNVYTTRGFRIKYKIDIVIKELYDRGWIVGADNLTMNDFRTIYKKLSLISA